MIPGGALTRSPQDQTNSGRGDTLIKLSGFITPTPRGSCNEKEGGEEAEKEFGRLGSEN